MATATLLSIPLAGLAQEAAKIPDSVAALAAKYDEARAQALVPLVRAFADQLKTPLMAEMARMGKPAVAVEFGEAAEALMKAQVAVLPREGAPFSAEAWDTLVETDTWKAFSSKFTAAETALNDSYKRALDREKATFQSKGDAYGMLAVENEVKRVAELGDGKQAPEPSAPVPGAMADPAKAKGKRLKRTELNEIEKQLLGGLWIDTKNESHQFFFRKDGSFTRVLDSAAGKRLSYTWALREDGVVLWGERSFVIQGPDRMQYIVPSGGSLSVHDLKLDPAGVDPGK